MEAEKKAFKITKREIGFVLGIVVFLLVKFLPLAELSSTVELTVGGQTCLALTLATVVFWACGVAQPGFVGLLYCALLVLFKVCVDDTGAASISATVASTFSSWTKATMWLVIGAYLIASAVKESGLGERIAYAFMLKFVRDAKSLIISIFALTFVLSLLIPHPFPRAFLILAVVSVIAESAGYGDDDKGKLGFLVFAAAAPGSMFFLTGDSTLNPLVAQYSAEAGGMSPSFVDWFLYMSVPMLVALLCTLFLGLFLFKPSKELVWFEVAYEQPSKELTWAAVCRAGVEAEDSKAWTAWQKQGEGWEQAVFVARELHWAEACRLNELAHEQLA